MVLPSFLEYAAASVSAMKYPLIFIGAIIEGPVLMVASGFFLRLGVFSAVPLYVAIVLGDLAGDVIWYFVGYYFAHPFIRRFGKFVGVNENNFDKVKTLFEKYHGRILIISKLTIGFGMALVTLMVAGATKVKFWTYILLNSVGELALVAALILLGFFFGHLYTYVEGGFRIIYIGGAIILALVCTYGFSRFVKEKIFKL